MVKELEKEKNEFKEKIEANYNQDIINQYNIAFELIFSEMPEDLKGELKFKEKTCNYLLEDNNRLLKQITEQQELINELKEKIKKLKLELKAFAEITDYKKEKDDDENLKNEIEKKIKLSEEKKRKRRKRFN